MATKNKRPVSFPDFFLNDEPPRKTTAFLEAERRALGQSVSAPHTALMRAKRDRPELVEAIIAVHGHNNPDNHPYKVAEMILPRVNAWLKKRHYKPVLADALARRIPHT
jgi:hypothetical protein